MCLFMISNYAALERSINNVSFVYYCPLFRPIALVVISQWRKIEKKRNISRYNKRFSKFARYRRETTQANRRSFLFLAMELEFALEFSDDEIVEFRSRRDATRNVTRRWSTRLVTIRVNCPAVAAPTRHSDVVMHSQARGRRCTFARRRADVVRLYVYSVVALSATRFERRWCLPQLFAAVSRSGGVSR